MELFDYVDYEWTCPNCGNKQKGCQTKHIHGKGYYDLCLKHRHPAECDSFMDFCDVCMNNDVRVHMEITIQAYDEDQDENTK
jgi:hypothetical protein